MNLICENIFHSIFDTIKKIPKESLFPLQINQGKIDTTVSDFSKFHNDVKITNKRSCTCNDIFCPHKQNISPMLLFLIRSRIEDCIWDCIKPSINFIDNFDPKKYQIYQENDFLFSAGEGSKEIYYRYKFKTNIVKQYELPHCNMCMFEGFIFGDNKPQSVKISCDGKEIFFNLVGKKFLPKKFFLHTGCLPYSKITFNFFPENQYECFIVSGNFTIFEKQIKQYFDEFNVNFEYDSKICNLLVSQGCSRILLK